MLVGTKIDLRDDLHVLDELNDKNLKAINVEQGNKLAREVGAITYLECSAATQVGVKEIFDYAIRAVLDPPTRGDYVAASSQGQGSGPTKSSSVAPVNASKGGNRRIKKAKRCTIL